MEIKRLKGGLRLHRLGLPEGLQLEKLLLQVFELLVGGDLQLLFIFQLLFKPLNFVLHGFDFELELVDFESLDLLLEVQALALYMCRIG